jgi:hypothetical protein
MNTPELSSSCQESCRVLLVNLAGFRFPFDDISGKPRYIDKDEAYKHLKEITGQDFGFNTEAWREWFIEYRPNELLYFPRGHQPKEKKTA